MGRHNVIGINKDDYDTYQEYNRERMRYYNKQKHLKTRLDRFYELVEMVQKFEEENDDASFIALRLASGCKYKLVIDKDMKGE